MRPSFGPNLPQRVTHSCQKAIFKHALEPKDERDDAILLEFKVQNPLNEAALSDTVSAALRQIAEKQYEAALQNSGIPSGRIRKYGFAFRGKEA